MDIKEIWKHLYDGGVVTNGEIQAWQEQGKLVCTPDCTVVPFNKDNADEWSVYEETNEPMYCRWYYEKATGEIVLDDRTWHLITEELHGIAHRIDEAFTKEQVLGLAD